MTDPITTVGTAATAAALAKLLDTEIIKNLLGPVTQQVGLMGGDLAGIVRMYTTFNLAQVLMKLARQRNNKPLQPAEFIRVIPLLQAASLVSDAELQEQWAALLESSVSEPDGVLPSFGQTLSQLTAEEARFLERLYEYSKNNDQLGAYRLGTLDDVQDLYDPELGLTYGEPSAVAEQLARKRVDHAALLLTDLLRLGLLRSHQISKDEMGTGFFEGRKGTGVFDAYKEPKLELETEYLVSAYAVSFIKAVTPVRK